MMSSQLGGISSLQTPPGNPKFVDLKPYYRCPFCQQVLRDSMQTTCGHRMCERCLPQMFQGKTPPVTCPANEEDCEPQTRESINPDPGARREIRKLKVHCSYEQFGCTFKPAWKDLEQHEANCDYKTVDCEFRELGCLTPVLLKKKEEHSKSCLYRPTPCQYCGQLISSIKHDDHQKNECEVVQLTCPWNCGSQPMVRRELQQHVEVCLYRPKKCKFERAGCDFEGTDQQVTEHNLNATNHHLELSTIFFANVELNTIEIRRELQEMRVERDQLFQQNQSLMSQLEKLSNSNKELKMKMVSITERLIHLEKKAEDNAKKSDVERHEKEMKALQKSLTEVRTQIAQIERRGGPAQGGAAGSSQEIQGLKQRLDVHDTQFAQLDVQFAELDLRFQIMESSNYSGVLLWKLRDYKRRKDEAISGKTLSLYSQPFYTHRFGYKMCARVYLNGDGVGKNDHMSLFFVIMKGEYDALLQWPFQQKVTMILVDQETGGINSLSDTFRPDTSSNSFQRPTTDMNVASGCPKFVKHKTLETSRFIKDDVLFLKFIVDLSNLNHP